MSPFNKYPFQGIDQTGLCLACQFLWIDALFACWFCRAIESVEITPAAVFQYLEGERLKGTSGG